MVSFLNALMWLSIITLALVIIAVTIKLITRRRLMSHLSEEQERQLPVKVIIFNSVLMTVSYLGLSFLSGGLL